ncbi:hypothetical protein QNH14_14935 [Apirhabdus apintestini]|uniref:glycine zipper domain-containing protein n=1 Tax=Erwinia sp. HR93 TaxID=3094840 RepID=UPI002ADEF250|nr:hypothetical protein [Erwinia sp. HR93]MEA1064227.1 hypothetical protein [Erwinia sp. HR93]WPM84233.1 hypothetical protein QNH14_14935 [Enterobacteriaceae bacterium CA-0114]
MFYKTDRKNRPNDVSDSISKLTQALESMINDMGQQATKQSKAARREAESLLKETRAQLSSSNCPVNRAACDAAASAQEWIRERPWYTLGICAAAGIALGALLASRR